MERQPRGADAGIDFDKVLAAAALEQGERDIAFEWAAKKGPDEQAIGFQREHLACRRLRRAASIAWTALRYGEWECGCEFYKGKPMIGVFSTWYDGRWIGAHFGPLDAYSLTLTRWGIMSGIDPLDFPDLWAFVQRVAGHGAVARVIERERLQINLFKPA